jgi:superfamily I DNA and RNA helicase
MEQSKKMNNSKEFEAAYNNLNEQQQQAVDHIDGPLLVLAGPGTGKTELLAIRVGRILQKTDTQPHNILCLTFTDAGAYAMRSQIIKIHRTCGLPGRNLHIPLLLQPGDPGKHRIFWGLPRPAIGIRS